MRQLLQTLQRIEDKLDRLLKFEIVFAKEMLHMSDQINAALAQLAADFDKETNDIAAKMDGLTAALAAASTPVDPAIMASLQAVSARLKSLGADASQPIPAAVA